MRAKSIVEEQFAELQTEFDMLSKRRKLDVEDWKQQELRYNTLIKVTTMHILRFPWDNNCHRCCFLRVAVVGSLFSRSRIRRPH